MLACFKYLADSYNLNFNLNTNKWKDYRKKIKFGLRIRTAWQELTNIYYIGAVIQDRGFPAITILTRR